MRRSSQGYVYMVARRGRVCSFSVVQLPAAIFKHRISLLPNNFSVPNYNHRAAGFCGSLAHALSSPTQGNLSTDKIWVT